MFHKICETYGDIKKAEQKPANILYDIDLTNEEKDNKEKEVICKSKKQKS